MKRNRLYLIEGHETYQTLDEIISYLKENGMKEVKVAVGKVERGTGFFFCKAKEERSKDKSTSLLKKERCLEVRKRKSSLV